MKDKISKVYDILCTIPVIGESQEKIVHAKNILKGLYSELSVDHEYKGCEVEKDGK